MPRPLVKTEEPCALPAEPWWLMRALPLVGLPSGFLGGLCGMNGTPFVLLVAFTGLDKSIARSIFPMGQFFEAWCFRLPMLLYIGRISIVDVHVYAGGLCAGLVGLSIGNYLSRYVSQMAFEHGLLLFLVLSSLSVLGILHGHPRAVVALGVSVVILALRIACSFMYKQKKADAEL